MSKKKNNIIKLCRKDNSQPEEVRAKIIIQSKIKILENWLAKGIPTKYDIDGNKFRDKDGELTIDYFPSSIQGFLKWNGSQNCTEVQNEISKYYGEIRGTGRATLQRYNDLYEQTENLIIALKQRANQQITKQNKLSKITQLEEESAMHSKSRELSEIKHRQAWAEINKLRERLNDEINAHKSSRKLWAVDLEKRDEEIVSLSSENRELTIKLAKVTPIKKVNK